MKHSTSRAFTLLELLVVMGLIVLLASLVIPAFNQIGAGQNITAAAESLAGRMELARQRAMSENERIELRLLKLSRDGGPNAIYSATQLVRVADNTPLDNPSFLPSGIEVFDQLKYSTLVSGENPLPEAGSNTTTVAGQSNVPFKAILFRADGSTHLSPDPPAVGSNAWTLTVVQSNKIQGNPSLPNNFATVMVDPVTGRSTVYRP